METELIQDFIEESRNAFEEIEALWLKLEMGRAAPEDFIELIHRLHLVSSVLRIGGHDIVAALAERITSILDRIQSGRLPASGLVNDVILFAIEHLESITEALMASQSVDLDVIEQKSHVLQQIISCDPDDITLVAEQALFVFTNKRLGVVIETLSVTPTALPQSIAIPTGADHKRLGDIAFFKDLSIKMERCNPDQLGRGARILLIANAMNQTAGQPVDPLQLEAAVYLHDFGMMLLPAETLRNMARLSDQEWRQIHEHPLSGTELLLRIGGWDEAARMVLQHHERDDGGGYPEKIRGDAICDGAKILAIADTIYAMTHKQSYRSFARPLFRAVSEINSCAGSQFAKHWVEIFNAAIKGSGGRILFNE